MPITDFLQQITSSFYSMSDLRRLSYNANSNPNDNSHMSTWELIENLLINLSVFVVLIIIFESNRFYKQIYLKRLQNKFRISDRVPPYPPETLFGWFFEIQQVTEGEILRMVGLDAYMCLRYIVVCYKLSLFLTFWGVLVLVPVYGSASIEGGWDRFSISNLVNGNESAKYRLWVSAVFSYIFSIYFCQLLYTEYNNFSVRRLQYLVQSDTDYDNLDPDTPPQKYFTVMIERIPSHLRSASALFNYFDKLFPDDVYTVEIAMDLKELDAVNEKRKRLRNKLEKAIAHYEARNERLEVYARIGGAKDDLNDGIFGDDNLLEFIQKLFGPDKFGYNKVDAISYYTEKLMFYNDQMIELQNKYNEMAAQVDETMQKRINSRFDTRVAAMFENIASKSFTDPESIAKVNSANLDTPKPKKPFHLESIIFGESAGTIDHAYKAEMRKVESETPAKLPPVAGVNQKLDHSYHSGGSQHSLGSRHGSRIMRVSSADARGFNQDDSRSVASPRPSLAAVSDSPIKAESTVPFSNAPPLPSLEALDPNSFEYNSTHSTHSQTSDRMDSSHHRMIDALSEDRTIREWMSKSKVDFEKEEADIARKRAGSISHYNDVLVRDAQAEIRSMRDTQAILNKNSRAPRRSGASQTLLNLTNTSGHGGSSHGYGPIDISGHGDEVKRANMLSSLAKTFLNKGGNSNHGYHELHKVLEGDEESGELSPGGIAMSKKYQADRDEVDSTKSVHNEDLNEDITEEIKEDMKRNYMRTETGGVATVLPVNMLTQDQLNELTKLSIERAKVATHQGWLQTKLAGSGALRGVIEIERAIEMVMLGAYYKYSSTAFVTFKSRTTESVAQQMLLSLDAMEINHAPNPHDIIWENVAIPKAQIVMRSYITNIGVIVGSIFWSSLVNSVHGFAKFFPLPSSTQNLLAAVIMLIFLLILPFIFDNLARNYEGMKLESEIQNSIMLRYFYYQLINVYVNVGFSGNNLWVQLVSILTQPRKIVDIVGGHLPNVSLFFTSLIIVKVFTAVPLEMIRPWQLSTIHLMGNCMDRRKSTRRDLRTGAFFSWPMLYGWIYPQLMMVLMIMVTYACITPLIMPFCALFFLFAYIMYKYQLLYVYINEYQSGGFMWYAVFNRTLVSLEFAVACLIGYLSLQLPDPRTAGPFFFLLPLPVCLIYFGKYCEHKFKKASENLSYGFAKELDHRNVERKAAGIKTPHDTFSRTMYRQPCLTDGPLYPEPYRNDGSYDILRNTAGESVVMADWRNHRANRKGSLSINVHELTDEGEEDPLVLGEYFHEVVLPLSSAHTITAGDENNEESDVPEVTRERR